MISTAATTGGSLPTRQIIRDALVERLSSAIFRIYPIDYYHINIVPCGDAIACKTHFETINCPAYSIVCDEDAVVVKMVRPTIVRVIVTIDYADPDLFEKLSASLSSIGVSLSS